MKSVISNKKGSQDKFVYGEVDKPLPDENEILVKTLTVSLNATDYRSMKLGLIPKKKKFGSDIAGTIE